MTRFNLQVPSHESSRTVCLVTLMIFKEKLVRLGKQMC